VNKDFKLTLKYIPLALAEKPKELVMSVGEFVTTNEIKQKLKELVDYSDKAPPFIAKVQNKFVTELVGREKFIKSILDKGEELVAYERPVLRDSNDCYTLIEVKIMQERRSMLMWSGLQPLTYSRLFIFDKRHTFRQIRKQIFSFFRPIF